jgi:hypothetical protein
VKVLVNALKVSGVTLRATAAVHYESKAEKHGHHGSKGNGDPYVGVRLLSQLRAKANSRADNATHRA